MSSNKKNTIKILFLFSKKSTFLNIFSQPKNQKKIKKKMIQEPTNLSQEQQPSTESNGKLLPFVSQAEVNEKICEFNRNIILFIERFPLNLLIETDVPQFTATIQSLKTLFAINNYTRAILHTFIELHKPFESYILGQGTELDIRFLCFGARPSEARIVNDDSRWVINVIKHLYDLACGLMQISLHQTSIVGSCLYFCDTLINYLADHKYPFEVVEYCKGDPRLAMATVTQQAIQSLNNMGPMIKPMLIPLVNAIREHPESAASITQNALSTLFPQSAGFIGSVVQTAQGSVNQLNQIKAQQGTSEISATNIMGIIASQFQQVSQQQQ